MSEENTPDLDPNEVARAALESGSPNTDLDGETYSAEEQEAMEHGWKPEGAEGKRNLSAEEFLDRQPLYDEMRSLKKQTRKLQEGMKAMEGMHDGIRARERADTIAELTAAKITALENDEYDQVVAIDDRDIPARAAQDAEAPEVDAVREVDLVAVSL